MMSQQPKKTSAYRNWVNVRDIEGKEGSVNWEDIQWWRVKETEQVLFLGEYLETDERFIKAKEKEIHNIEENDVFEWVQDSGQSTISTKWVISEKITDDESSVVKARLVARGFEESKEEMRTDSPTCSKQSLRMIFTVSSTMAWELNAIDITSAFLQGNAIERNVFLQPPTEVAEPGYIWKLKRCIYGLCDAPRSWYTRVKEELINLGGVASQYDKCLYLWYHDDGSLRGPIALHVDDFVFCGTCEWNDTVIHELCTKFKISKSEKWSFRYLGINVVQTKDSVYVDQNNYIQELKPIEIDGERALQKEGCATNANREEGSDEGMRSIALGCNKYTPSIWHMLYV